MYEDDRGFGTCVRMLSGEWLWHVTKQNTPYQAPIHKIIIKPNFKTFTAIT